MIGTKFKAINGNDTEWVVIASHGLFTNVWKCYPATKIKSEIKHNLIQHFSTDFIKLNEIIW